MENLQTVMTPCFHESKSWTLWTAVASVSFQSTVANFMQKYSLVSDKLSFSLWYVSMQIFFIAGWWPAKTVPSTVVHGVFTKHSIS